MPNVVTRGTYSSTIAVTGKTIDAGDVSKILLIFQQKSITQEIVSYLILMLDKLKHPLFQPPQKK
jgi:hypothetical protein